MASQGAPHRYFWAWPTQELGPSYSHHRTVEIPPPKSRDLPLGSVSLLALMPTSSIATSGQKRGAQEGKVAAPPHLPKWICGALFPAAGGSETADRGGVTGSRVHILETATFFLQSHLPQFPSIDDFVLPGRTERAGQHTPTQTSRYSKKTRQIPQPHPKLAQYPQGSRDIFHGSVPPCHTTTWIEIGYYQDPTKSWGMRKSPTG